MAAKITTQVFTRKAPSMVRNSPTKPPVPGSPTLAKVNTMKQAAYIGMRTTSPPYAAISRVCMRS